MGSLKRAMFQDCDWLIRHGFKSAGLIVYSVISLQKVIEKTGDIVTVRVLQLCQPYSLYMSENSQIIGALFLLLMFAETSEGTYWQSVQLFPLIL